MGAACAASAAGDRPLAQLLTAARAAAAGCCHPGSFRASSGSSSGSGALRGKFLSGLGFINAENPKPKPRSYIASSKPVIVNQKSNSPIKFCCTTHTNQAVVTLPAPGLADADWSVVSVPQHKQASVKPFHDATTLTSRSIHFTSCMSKYLVSWTWVRTA